MKSITNHLFLYIFEFLIIIFGFIFLLNSDLNFLSELVFLVFILGLYSALGIIRHKRDRNIDIKIVLEYIFVSLIIAISFILVNTVRY